MPAPNESFRSLARFPFPPAQVRGEVVSRAVSTVWVAWLVLMAGANLATPLYAREFGFSSLVLTSIFAT